MPESSLEIFDPTRLARPGQRSYPPRVGGRYRLMNHIGGGGMADVYSAEDEQLGGYVAIKLLRPDIATPEMRLRMMQEARAAARVGHPNVVRVYGVDAVESTVYIVMELLRGVTLERLLTDSPDQRLPWREAITLLLPAMAAVHALNERGFVHRDIKPANLFVPAAGGRCEGAIVLDLGIARQEPAMRTEHSPAPTEIGRVLGTPTFMSPEQSEAGALDPRSDVYSMAVTLYRAIVGRPPFVSPDCREQLLVMHVFEAPPTMRRVAPSARIPREVAAVIHGALAKDPEARPQSMQAFAQALRRAAGVSPAPAWPVTRWLAAAGVAGSLLLVGAGVGAWSAAVAAEPALAAVVAAPESVKTPTPTLVVVPEAASPAAAPDTTVVPPEAASPAAAPDTTVVSEAASPASPELLRRRSVQDARSFLAAQSPRLARCAEGLAGGAVAVTIHVTFTAADLPPDIVTEQNAAFYASNCVARELRSLVFPRVPVGTAIRHTFTLSPKETAA